MQHVLCDGAIVPADEALVDSRDRTLLYGLGAFETFRLHGGVPFRLERHLARLARSLGAFGLDVPASVADLAEQVPRLAEIHGVASAMCRVTVTAGSGEGAGGIAPMRVLAHLRAVPEPVAGQRVVVGVAPALHDARSPVVGVKSTNYLVNYLLRERAEREGRCDDLMVDGDGFVTEGTVSTVFVVRGGVLVTPPLNAGVLEGVTRAEVLDIAAEQGLVTQQAMLALDDVRTAEACFLTGAGKGLVAVDEVDGSPLPTARPVVERLAAGLAERIGRCCGVDPDDVCF